MQQPQQTNNYARNKGRQQPQRAGGRHVRGQAMTEFMLVASFSSVALFAMPALTEYSTVRMKTVSAARMVAWQRTAWLPTATSNFDLIGVSGAQGAIKKSDAEIERDLKRHIFRDRRASSDTVHGDEGAEFATDVMATSPGSTIRATSIEGKLPGVLNVTDTISNSLRKAQLAIGGTDITRSLGNFAFVTGGYFRNQVDVAHTMRHFPLLPQANMTAQVTMLTEPWNAGGTNREEAKVQGLVPMKMADLPFMQQIRSAGKQTARTIAWVLPGFDVKLLEFGLSPGKAEEKSPLDRFELTAAAEAGGVKREEDKFRYYRSFPPSPVVETLP